MVSIFRFGLGLQFPVIGIFRPSRLPPAQRGYG